MWRAVIQHAAQSPTVDAKKRSYWLSRCKDATLSDVGDFDVVRDGAVSLRVQEVMDLVCQSVHMQLAMQ